MTIYYLYIKTHNKTGLKYLGQTSTNNPYTYNGSGLDWKGHIKQFGNDISTEILAECKSKSELNSFGRFYSNYYKVTSAVDDYGNRIWANRIPETGGGGSPSCQTREKLRQSQLGKKKPPRNPEHTEKIAMLLRGRKNPKTASGLRKWYRNNPNRTATIEKQAASITQWYVDNPEMKSVKANKAWNTRVLQDYDRLNAVNKMILSGATNTEIQSQVKIDYATIQKLRNRTHRFFSVFK